jgi:hypothetical protein
LCEKERSRLSRRGGKKTLTRGWIESKRCAAVKGGNQYFVAAEGAARGGVGECSPPFDPDVIEIGGKLRSLRQAQGKQSRRMAGRDGEGADMWDT